MGSSLTVALSEVEPLLSLRRRDNAISSCSPLNPPVFDSTLCLVSAPVGGVEDTNEKESAETEAAALLRAAGVRAFFLFLKQLALVFSMINDEIQGAVVFTNQLKE